MICPSVRNCSAKHSPHISAGKSVGTREGVAVGRCVDVGVGFCVGVGVGVGLAVGSGVGLAVSSGVGIKVISAEAVISTEGEAVSASVGNTEGNSEISGVAVCVAAGCVLFCCRAGSHPHKRTIPASTQAANTFKNVFCLLITHSSP